MTTDSTLTRRLTDLVRLPTVSQPTAFAEMSARTGWTTPQAETFAAAYTLLHGWLRDLGADIGRQAVDLPGFEGYNLWGRIPGRDNSRAILLQGHYDVVDANGLFTPTLEDNRLYGRGTADMKGALVAALGAVERIITAGQQPAVDVYLLFTCEEEVGARASLAFSQQPPDWMQNVVFALCMEPSYRDGQLELCTQHPGTACVVVECPLEPVKAAPGWRVRLELDKKHVRHASRQPLTLDANTVMVHTLKAMPGFALAALHSDRPITGAANSTSYLAEAIITSHDPLAAGSRVSLLMDALLHEHIAEKILPAFLTGEQQPLIQLTVEAVEPRAGFAAGGAVQALTKFRHRVKTDYGNAMYAAPPFTIAALALEDGLLRAKIDIRPDAALHRDLERLLADTFPPPCHTRLLWNDPVLDGASIVANPYFGQFQQVCQRYTPAHIAPKSGWTEAAVWSGGLGLPTLIAGPGESGVIHTSAENMDLHQLAQMSTILEEFLLYVE